MEKPAERAGDNLYPVQFKEKFGSYELDLEVPGGVWNPTPHGVHLGNMISRLDFTGAHVLELGTGCGIHAILLGLRGAKRLTLTEIDEPTLENCRHNLARNGVDVPVDGHVADWTHLPDSDHDVLITNPPFAKSGKHYRRYFIDTLILNAHKLVRPGGQLIFIQSSMANIPRSITLMEECGMSVEILGETSGPFRRYYFEDPTYLKEMAAIPGAYWVHEGQHYERLIAFRSTLPN